MGTGDRGIGDSGILMWRPRMVVVAVGALLGAGLAILERTAAGRRLSRRVARRVTRAARYESGRLDGLRYHLAGRSPDPSVTDALLADRVRSAIGPLEHRLDVPRVHVLACGHDVMLHGDVGSEDEAARLVDAVQAVPGVGRVDSHLHVGYFAGDSRPSEGAGSRPESAALHSLMAAAHGGGAEPGTERAAARAVLSTFVGALPQGERRHVLGHLPGDVRALLHGGPSVRHGAVRRLDEFAVAALPTLEPTERRTIVESVLGALRELVPEESSDISAVLPDELRRAWKTAIPL